MTDDRWADTIDRITAQYVVLEQGSESVPEYPNGRREFITFEGPIGRVRLERLTKPRTLGERAITSRRIGGATRVESIYDVHDFVHILEAKRWDVETQSWVPIDARAFS